MNSTSIDEAMASALAHHQAGRLTEAEGIYRHVLERQPNNGNALYLLGLVAQQTARNELAVEMLRRAADLHPNSAEILASLGASLGVAGQLEDAAAVLQRAVQLRPDLPDAHLNLGNTYAAKGEPARAIECYNAAIRCGADPFRARFNRARALRSLGRNDEAVADLRGAIAVPSASRHMLAEAYLELGTLLAPAEEPSDVEPLLREAARLNPSLSAAQEKLLHLDHYLIDADPQGTFNRHRQWARQFAEPLSVLITPHENDPDPARRLRVGYVSPNFCRHSVAYFLEPLLASHDKQQVEVFCYADELKRDATTDRMQASADAWRNITAQSHAQVAQWIRQDQIDILIDLAGHVGTGRLLVFARKPAPVQVSYLGYPDTTGVATIDYRLTDDFADPSAESDSCCVEKLFRIGGCAWCYRAEEPSPEPELRNPGIVTFGSFNVAMKINRWLIELWAQLLHAVPGSRLLIKDGQGAPSPAHPRLRREFARLGIPPERLELLSFTPGVYEHLDLYNQVDVALDTFPYNGTTTTCEAMWMGRPVVTLAGTRHVSRVGRSLLSAVGLSDLVAQTPQQYVRLAAELARNVQRCDELRHGLRQRMRNSMLMDWRGFARRVEAAYRQMWTRWCAQRPER